MPATPLKPPVSYLPQDTRMARWALLSAAAAVAVFLMVTYVQLLNHSMARGAHWRYSQTTLQTGTVSTPSSQVELVGSRR